MSTAIYQEYMTIPGVVASGTVNQYYVVQVATTAGAVKAATTPASDKVLGVLQNDPASGQPAEVACVGVCLAAAEASVAYGDWVAVSSTGRVKTTTADKDEVVGMALQASAAAGDVIPVLLSRFTLSI